jgi:hypothetical protein
LEIYASQAEAFAAEIYNSGWKQVVRNWDGPDAKSFAGIYKSNWVCSAGRVRVLRMTLIKVVI